MKQGVNLLALSLLVTTTCAEVTLFLAMEPPLHQRVPPPMIRHGAGMRRGPNTSVEMAAWRDIEASCASDVVLHCSMDDPMLLLNNDPMLSWMVLAREPLSLPPPPPFHSDIETLLDRMMDSALTLPFEEDEPVHMEQPRETHVDHAFDTMVTSLAHHFSESADEPKEEAEEEAVAPPVFDAAAFAKRVVDHGNEVLQEQAPEERHRLARRLTAVEPEMFMHPRLPFGCHKNRCLWKAFDDGKLSPPCAASLKNLEGEAHVQQERRQEALRNVHRMEQQQDAFLLMVLVYGILALSTMLLLIRRFRKHSMPNKRRLKRRILQAIYSNPELKAKVEEELEEELGAVPPLPPHALATMSSEGRRRLKQWRQCRVVRLAGFAFLMWMAIVQPFVTMFLLCIMMGARLLKLCCCPKEPIEDCTCCCCGGSTKDVREGNVSAAQECCTCCRGTGVCAPGCDACCGGDPCGCDCQDGCNCCDPGCTCCCCNVSERDVRMGKVTAAQECCSCCRGTGVCAPGCDACCNGGSCCCDCPDGCDCCSGSSSEGCSGGSCSNVGPPCQGFSPSNRDGPPGTRRRAARCPTNAAYEGVPFQVV